jgi:hypothetical protein
VENEKPLKRDEGDEKYDILCKRKNHQRSEAAKDKLQKLLYSTLLSFRCHYLSPVTFTKRAEIEFRHYGDEATT